MRAHLLCEEQLFGRGSEFGPELARKHQENEAHAKQEGDRAP